MTTPPKKDHPGVKFPPPLLFLAMLIIAWGLNKVFPVTLGLHSPGKPLGITICSLGLCNILYIAFLFKKAKTQIEPWKPTSKIVTHGPYAISRNPIYISMCCAPVGLGVYTNSMWIFLSFLPSLYLVYHIAVKKEEAYLKGKFPHEYPLYKAKVRRWL